MLPQWVHILALGPCEVVLNKSSVVEILVTKYCSSFLGRVPFRTKGCLFTEGLVLMRKEGVDNHVMEIVKDAAALQMEH